MNKERKYSLTELIFMRQKAEFYLEEYLGHKDFLPVLEKIFPKEALNPFVETNDNERNE